MPKIIENLKERIIEVSKTILEEQGYNALTSRAISSRCGVASGTIYNYFESKEMIVGTIIYDDWKNVLKGIDCKLEKATSKHEGISVIAEGLEGFCADHEKLWREYAVSKSATSYYDKGHDMLIEALSKRVEKALGGSDSDQKDRTAAVLSEALVALAVHGKHYRDYSDILDKMFDTHGGNI